MNDGTDIAATATAPQIEGSNVQGKRWVLERTSGPRKGMMEILGYTADPLPTLIGVGDPPGEGKSVNGASLIRVTPRAAYYREIWMNPTGKLGSFHPEQR